MRLRDGRTSVHLELGAGRLVRPRWGPLLKQGTGQWDSGLREGERTLPAPRMVHDSLLSLAQVM